MSVLKEDDLTQKTMDALKADVSAIRAALYWLSHHPQLSPMFYTLGKYAANHTLTSCLSRGTCQNCNRCLHLLGMDIDHVGAVDLCESALISAYAEALHNPYYSLQMANKGIELIRQAIAHLASMPVVADQYHKELASYIKTIGDKLNFENTLKKGHEIYDRPNATEWLYVGLPEVLAKIKQSAVKEEREIEGIIENVYNKWRKWGEETKKNTPV